MTMIAAPVLRGSSLILATLSAPAFADSTDSPPAPETVAAPTLSTSTYPASFFSTFSPRSALDIVTQVPGFQLNEGNSDIRGFAGAAGNVVFNGARPSSKSESLSTILSRIPASRVIRVDLGPGSLYGSEYAGKPQVLNIILSAEGGLDGTVTASALGIWDGTVVPNASASLNWKTGSSQFTFAAGTGRDDRVDEGTDRITDPADGTLLEKRRKKNHYRPRQPFVSGSWALEQGTNKSIHLNGRFDRFTENFIQTSRVYPLVGDERDDRLYLTAKSPGFELGGDITRPLGGGAIKLVGLLNRRHRVNLDTQLYRIDDSVVGGYEQGSESQRNETIGRLSWTHPSLAGMAVEVGAEAALNTLDYSLDLYSLGAGGAKTRIDLPIDNATVREKRAEVYAKAGKQVSKAIRIDAGLNYETSDLTVRGDTSAERSLHFLKPSLTLDWRGKKQWHGQLSVRRTVAQLDFYDFLSSAELSNDRVNGGNANLQPQRTWEFRATLDRPLLKTGLVKLDVGYDAISMLQDRILTEEGYDAPGNLGNGTRLFASLNVDAPLDSFGLRGTRLKLNGTVQRTNVEDPITGDDRRFTGYFPEWEWYAELRRDTTNWAYGLNVSDRDRIAFFRNDEEDVNWNGGPYGNAFVEYRPSAQSTITLDVLNLFGTKGLRDRIFTFPDRSYPGPTLDEFRERNNHQMVRLTFKRNFGGAKAAQPEGA